MMTIPQQRETVVNLVDEAVTAGARRSPACQVVGINVRTLQRWRAPGEQQVRVDQRPLAKRPEPTNKLSETERQELLEVCNQPEYASLPPSQIVPKLADEGRYIASESTFYRTLKAHNQLHHRSHQSPAKAT